MTDKLDRDANTVLLALVKCGHHNDRAQYERIKARLQATAPRRDGTAKPEIDDGNGDH